ncbi:patatin-like phospholipase family protein [Geothermobacter hydrogeniphilus]|uniref:PNPLA domain-containing protein n=1 Tax=Geothermobacter hydrogeniphilus TaxID=1969733 RepID=A0A1X0XJY4_9BACT|nr:patatin-like phospholipase family protein [Geothermobacter hydrogeniphilus]ORJ53215.1 hypothetical protein B5V00_16520 [Geothermobacter hydrogeniphilus]
MTKKFKVGLALGGGAARAFSHIGVIAGLVRHGIAIDIITGTSMGAIIGGMYASNPDAKALKERFASYLESEEFSKAGFDFFRELDSHGEGILFEVAKLARRGVFNALMVTQTALVKTETAESSYAFLLDDIRIEQTRVPFAAVALDLVSGRPEVLDQGPLRQAVAASCAMPGVLEPVALDGRQLVDGGWAETIPIKAARQLGADFVIAIDAGGAPRPFSTPRNAIDVISRADALVRNALTREQLRRANIVLCPKNGVEHWADFSQAGEAIVRGEQEVERQIDFIRQEIQKARGKSWIPRIALPHLRKSS